jgi:hypothetical protein
MWDYQDPSDWEMEQGYREELRRLHENDAQMPGEAEFEPDEFLTMFDRERDEDKDARIEEMPF